MEDMLGILDELVAEVVNPPDGRQCFDSILFRLYSHYLMENRLMDRNHDPRGHRDHWGWHRGRLVGASIGNVGKRRARGPG